MAAWAFALKSLQLATPNALTRVIASFVVSMPICLCPSSCTFNAARYAFHCCVVAAVAPAEGTQRGNVSSIVSVDDTVARHAPADVASVQFSS
jgi:hypothetical protein